MQSQQVPAKFTAEVGLGGLLALLPDVASALGLKPLRDFPEHVCVLRSRREVGALLNLAVVLVSGLT